jgi:deoxycytidylate deaminase
LDTSDTQAELVFGFVYSAGTSVDPVASLLKDYLKQFSYTTHEFRVSSHLRTLDVGISYVASSNFGEMNALMDAGNEARSRAHSNEILAVMAVNDIAANRTDQEPLERVAHIIRSLKTPDEVRLLREVYRPGFFLIGIASDDDEQHQYLEQVKGLTPEEARIVIKRDQDEQLTYGQRTRDTFYLADVFVELTEERYKSQLERFLELVFGHPFKTPTREEHAMFLAYASSARSAQFGRQVGAAISTLEGEVIAVGFNEVPRAGGGPYWGEDVGDGRDHAFGGKIDSNDLHRSRIVDSIVQNLDKKLLTEVNLRAALSDLDDQANEAKLNEQLKKLASFVATTADTTRVVRSSALKEITEYGRAVHAEMDALLTCARLGVGVKGKKLFTTTFPCHNCTRHIIAGGVSSVTYIEPYPKSRAMDLHSDAICFSYEDAEKTGRIPFVPFVGIGPRRYLDLFSLDLSTGRKITRKGEDGAALFPKRATRPPRVPMLPFSYLERESKLLQEHEDVLKLLEGNNHEQPTRKDPSQEQYSMEPSADDPASEGDS